MVRQQKWNANTCFANALQICARGPKLRPPPNLFQQSIKLGLEFFLAHGAPGVRYAFPTPVRATGVGFFLDLKLHDIPNTVAGGIRAVVELAPTFITIHASGGREMMKAAVDEVATQAAKHNVPRPKLLGVTVLTSLDRSDLEATGVNADPSDQVLRLAALAHARGG